MNRQITRLAVTGMGLIVALVVATTYWQVWAAGDLADRQDNQIQRVAQFTIERGDIRSRGLNYAINRAKKVGGRTLYFREYPQRGLAAHVHGYSTQSRFRTGLERSMNDYLTGQNANLSTVLDTTLDRLKGGTIEGNDLVLTLNPKAQRAALEALGTRCGAVVALEVRTGKVRVMASSPTYDPNLVEGHFNRVTNVRADCKRPDALLNRATAGLYAPGSTFKVVTASAAIDSGRFTPTSSFVDPGYCEVYGKRVNNYDTTSPFGRLDLRHGAQVLGQLGLLQHRQGAGSEEARRLREALRLLLHPAARDADERTRSERPLQGDQALRPAGGHRRRSRPVRVRPGAAARDTAADGDGRRDDREQRRRDEAVRRRAHRGAGRIDRRAQQAAGSRPSSQAHDGQSGRRDDAGSRRGRHRHRGTHPGRHGRRQDRHRGNGHLRA